MKRLLLVLFTLSFNALAITDIMVDLPANKNYMNFFYEGYLPWFEKSFNYRPTLPKNEVFFNRAIRELDHWRTPEYANLEQFLIGQSFTKDKAEYYIRIYLHKNLRHDPFIKALNLPNPVLFVEYSKDQGMCFITHIPLKDVFWKSVPRFQKLNYFAHYCEQSGKKLVIKNISLSSQHENMDIPNPFRGQADHELQTYSEKGIESIMSFVKTTHTAFINKKHIPYINLHGTETLLPFDKYSIWPDGHMRIYYP